MATYAIGDIQGCFEPFMRLLALVEFNPKDDTLWLTGDIVNRGKQSLETLRFIKNLNHRSLMVLGNHDLHVLALAFGVREESQSDTVQDILAAKDKTDLIEWLRHQPLMHVDQTKQMIMTHAGISPLWTSEKAQECAKEIEHALRQDNVAYTLKNFFGAEPALWDDHLEGVARLRCIINYFTRMRFCDAHGRLDFSYKGDIHNAPPGLMPWFSVPHRAVIKEKIIFGHWASLNGKVDLSHIVPLDTGCVWGNCLTAMRLEDGLFFKVSCART